jgi:large subunit ribosomal protein L6
MSRIGKNPITLPSGVTVSIKGSSVKVKGPKGELEQSFQHDMKIELKDDQILVSRPSESKRHKSLHGLTRSLIANMVEGVSKGFVKEMEIRGIEYKVMHKGKSLVLSLGYSHPVIFPIMEGIEVEIEEKKMKVKGINKQQVGEVAAEIRALRPPEPYKGKGIRYVDEIVKIKAGKTAVGTGF